jgi:hypothetical protein
MFANAKNTVAKAKLVFNKKLKMYKLVCAFNVHKKLVGEEFKYSFPVQSKCNFVSGDIDLEDLPRVLSQASAILRTNNIQIVE